MASPPEPRKPKHIAIIMDGNNRWAKARGLSGTTGHRAGAEAAKKTVDACIRRDIRFLTLFAFSSENWQRPKDEVRGLMALFLSVLKRQEIQEFHRRNARIQFIGTRSHFSPKLQRHMSDVERMTCGNTGITVTIAADYGGRWDITQAMRRIAGEIQGGTLSVEQITPELVQAHVCLADIPDPDLCIRTAGERRISNFLLWQLAYTELYFTDCLWPDFDDAQLQRAIDDFASRERRFGRNAEQLLVE